jgi:hypothetical protein
VAAALTDVASGLNEKRRVLHRLLDLAQQHQAGIVAVEYQDRLARFEFSYKRASENPLVYLCIYSRKGPIPRSKNSRGTNESMCPHSSMPSQRYG